VTTLVQIVVLLLGLGAGFVWTRRAPVVCRETVVNLATGALLFPVRLGLTMLGIDVIHVGLVDLAPLPAWLQLAVCLVTLDFARYWLHFAHHRVPFLWRFHRVHHSAEHIDASVGLRMHVVDFLQLSAVPVLLFGVLFDTTGGPWWVVPTALSVGIVFDAVEHANVRFPVERPWARAWYTVLNTPLFHSWHHVRDGHLCDGNYANVFPMWDRLFGTAILRDRPPESYGIEAGEALRDDPLGLQLLRRRGEPRPVSDVVRAAGSRAV
jgi:sterol desaturase/sphingolipid hydroxylase (fatty acid hydroxylase superfamily)